MYIISPSPICLQLDKHDVDLALSRAWAKTGNRMAARIAMMAMTTSNSIRVKPLFDVDIVYSPPCPALSEWMPSVSLLSTLHKLSLWT